jgi:predicted O-linked N-acetylglucosamine transferase (SPINDLY family)
MPVVTLPGPMMRGRHSYAILKMMGLVETIARDEDHYVEIAVRLGKDGAWRRHITENVEETRSRVFNDETPIRALEDFFESVCGPAS